MAEVAEKIYCVDNDHTLKATDIMAMMNNGGFGNNGMWNNPFAYIIFMWLMRYMNNGYGDGFGAGSVTAAEGNFNSRQIAQIQETLNSNQNSNLLMDAIKGNASAIADLANHLNVNFNTLSQAICGVRSSIEAVGGQVGYSAEKVINAVNLGDLNIIQQLKDNIYAVNENICAVKQGVIASGYENQLAIERQTNNLGSKIDYGHAMIGSKIDTTSAANQLQNCQQTNTLQTAINTNGWNISNAIDSNRNALIKGVADLGYLSSTNTANIINAINAAQQRTSDQLSNHWQAETSLALQDAKAEISQLKQTQALIAVMRGNESTGCGCFNNGCGC